MKKAYGYLITALECLFVLSTILSSGTMYGVTEANIDRGIDDFTLRAICLIISFALLLVYLFQTWLDDEVIISRKNLTSFLVSAAIIMGFILISRFKFNSYLENFAIPSLLFMAMAAVRGPRRFMRTYLNWFLKITLVISVISLFFFVFGTALRIIPCKQFLYLNNDSFASGESCFNLYFTNEWQTQTFASITFVRNIGIFMEAPGFAIPLLISLWWCLYSQHNNKPWELVVLIMTLMTTFSTKAFIIGIILGLVWFIQQINRGFITITKRNFIPLAMLVICGLGVAIGIYIIKMTGVDSRSFEIRMGDSIAAFKTFLQNPLIGAGFYNLEALYANFPEVRTTGDPTNGLLNVLAFHGIFLIVWYVWGLIKLRYYSSGNKTKDCIFSLILLILGISLTSAIQYQYIFLCIFAIGWVTNKPYELVPDYAYTISNVTECNELIADKCSARTSQTIFLSENRSSCTGEAMNNIKSNTDSSKTINVYLRHPEENKENPIRWNQVESILRKRWKIFLLLIVLFAGGFGAADMLFMSVHYKASGSVYLVPELEEAKYSEPDFLGEMSNLKNSLVPLVTSQPVLSQVVTDYPDLTFKQLEGMVSASIIGDSDLVSVTVNAPTSEEAVTLCSKVLTSLVDVAHNQLGFTTLRVINEPLESTCIRNISLKKSLVAGATLGFVLDFILFCIALYKPSRKKSGTVKSAK